MYTKMWKLGTPNMVKIQSDLIGDYELTQMFDIDKFFLSTMYYREQEDPTATTHSQKRKNTLLTSEFEQNSKKYWANQLIKAQITILKNYQHNIGALHGSIDADTAPLTALDEEIDKKNIKGVLMPCDATSLRKNIDSKLSFATGKTGIGPFALNNNNHILAVIYGLKFEHTEGDILDILGLERLCDMSDRHGHSIQSWLSGLINAHVDVAKNPYIRRLGVNGYTYNLTNLLIRTGYGKETFYFLTQPVMQKFYNAFDIASGVYQQDETKSVYVRRNEEIEKAYCKYMNDNLSKIYQSYQNTDSQTYAINQFKSYFEDKFGKETYYKAIQALIRDEAGVKHLQTISTTNESKLKDKTFNLEITNESNDKVKIALSFFEVQALVAATNFELQEKAQLLSNLVSYSKIDTKKHGRTLSEQDHYLSGFSKLLGKNSGFEQDGIYRMLGYNEDGELDTDSMNGCFIGYKTEVATDVMRKLLQTQLYQGTATFQSQANHLAELLNSSRSDAGFSNSIASMILAKIKSRYFFDGPTSYCVRRGIKPASLLNKRGRNSIYKRLNDIKSAVYNKDNHKYDWLRAEDGGCRNVLLRLLIQDSKESVQTIGNNQLIKSAGFITDNWFNSAFIRNPELFDDNIKSDELQSAWEDMLNDNEHPEIQKFAEDLVVYAFMTSADNGGRLDLFKYVPLAWRLGEVSCLDYEDKKYSYASWSEDVLQAYQNEDGKTSTYDTAISDEEFEEMILNYHCDDSIVRTQSLRKFNNCTKFYGTQMSTPLIIGAINQKAVGGPKLVFNSNEFPTYFKVDSGKARTGQRKWYVYKFIGFGQTQATEKSKSITYPIYALVSPRGGKYAGGQRIYDIGLQSTIKNVNYLDAWKEFVTDIYKPENGGIFGTKYAFQSPGDILNQLVYAMRTGSTEVLEKAKKLVDEHVGMSKTATITYAPINLLAGDMYNYLKGSDKLNEIDDIDKKLKRNADAKNEYIEYSTRLNLDKINSKKYSKIPDNIVPEGFSQDTVNTIRRLGMNVEFYYKHFEYNGKQYKFPVAAISHLEEKNKGFFEIGAEIDLDSVGQGTENIKLTGTYQIHFKTQNAKHFDESNPYASAPLTAGDKQAMFKQLIRIIPNGAIVSTRGELTDGGVHALETLDQYGNNKVGYLVQVDTRTVLKKDGTSVDIPVWKKVENKPSENAGGVHMPVSFLEKKQNVEESSQRLQNVLGTFESTSSEALSNTTIDVLDKYNIQLSANELRQNKDRINSIISSIGSTEDSKELERYEQELKHFEAVADIFLENCKPYIK